MNKDFLEGFEKAAGVSAKTLAQAIVNRLKGTKVTSNKGRKDLLNPKEWQKIVTRDRWHTERDLGSFGRSHGIKPKRNEGRQLSDRVVVDGIQRLTKKIKTPFLRANEFAKSKLGKGGATQKFLKEISKEIKKGKIVE